MYVTFWSQSIFFLKFWDTKEVYSKDNLGFIINDPHIIWQNNCFISNKADCATGFAKASVRKIMWSQKETENDYLFVMMPGKTSLQ